MEGQPPSDLPAATGEESSSDRRARLALSFAISVGAVTLAMAHLVWPDAELDSITVVLLVVALLPWLGAIFKTIKLPFGLEVEYWRELRVIQERQAELDSRVSSVETQMFQVLGAATPAQETLLDSSLRAYATYLDGLGLSWEGDLPTVVVADEGDPFIVDGALSFYDPESNRIVVHPHGANDTELTLRPYTHPPLYNRQGGIGQKHGRVREVESGLADYLVSSHRGDPVVGRQLAERYGRPFIQDLTEAQSFEHLPKPFPYQNRVEAESAWASLFWALRGLLGQRDADTLLVDCWVSCTGAAKFDRSFVERVVDLAPESSRAAVEALLTERGAGP